jgi:uncharacterized membrane protein
MSGHQEAGGAEAPRRGFLSHLRGYFLGGILVTAPITLTIYLTYAFIRFVDRLVTQVVPPEYYPQTGIPGIGLVFAAIFFILVGWLARNFVGRLIIRISEYIVHRMPVIRTIYGALKQVFETVMSSQSTAFRDVVMFEYPRKGIWALGFVTGVTKGEVQTLTDDELVNVFFPTTPTPASGVLLFVPRKDLVYLKMSVEDALKLVISGGILTPPEQIADAKKKPA